MSLDSGCEMLSDAQGRSEMAHLTLKWGTLRKRYRSWRHWRSQPAFATLRSEHQNSFERTASVMRSVSHVRRGAFRAACRVALNETVRGCEEREGTRQVRGWKLFMFVPRMLCTARHEEVPKGRLEDRFRRFAGGQWVDVVNESSLDADRASVTTSRRSGRTLQCLSRWGHLAQMHQMYGPGGPPVQITLTLSASAPNTLRTLAALTDPARRLPEARAYLDDIVLETRPVILLELSRAKFFEESLHFETWSTQEVPQGGLLIICFHILASPREDRRSSRGVS